mmetsp:Transcript_78734/g.230991  ORF Transcript_78734/g.230991 Transcript_78734/m.230991 type:complete len:393 (+) Transcript_78734:430-1608(+)
MTCLPRMVSGFAFSSALATSASMPESAPTTAATPTSSLSCANLSLGTPGEPVNASDWRMPSTFSLGRSKLHSPFTKFPTSWALRTPSPSLSYLTKRLSCFSAALCAACLFCTLSLVTIASRFRVLTLGTRLSTSRSAVWYLLRNMAASCRVLSWMPWSLRYFPDMKSAQAFTALRAAIERTSNSSAILMTSSSVLPCLTSMDSVISLLLSTLASARSSKGASSPWSCRATASISCLFASSRSCSSRSKRAFSSSCCRLHSSSQALRCSSCCRRHSSCCCCQDFACHWRSSSAAALWRISSSQFWRCWTMCGGGATVTPLLVGGSVCGCGCFAGPDLNWMPPMGPPPGSIFGARGPTRDCPLSVAVQPPEGGKGMTFGGGDTTMGGGTLLMSP